MLALDEDEVIDAFAEALKVGSGYVEVDLIAPVMDAEDLVRQHGAARFHLVADLGRGRCLGREIFLARLCHREKPAESYFFNFHGAGLI
jgi:hypothetical protein